MTGFNTNNQHIKLSRTAFVTIGATAGFRSLLREVVSPKFLSTLRSLNFTHLVVQCGPDLDYFETIRPDQTSTSSDVKIAAFPYAPDLKQYYLQASQSDGDDGYGKRDRGVIISHAAGSGSIIEALEFDSKLVAVPNPELMDNHQLEIAEEMESQGFLIHGTLGSVAEAVEKADTTALRKWPPGPSPGSAYQKGGLWEAINELMPQPT
ncbi:hypothetical protein FHL15_002037 [Xylaria flabelliformis]|uniref:UDP-N-acetylglucosamine transferase subunit ALG13 n=1 Tax=Xylaria flabelliformis TaxID=2512241 RepID=A0A553IAL1_9PEZI|nr:hypothetical protein FHL15_002037 [Xylaria flabelliformis]